MTIEAHYAEVANEAIGYIKKQASNPYARALFATAHTTLLGLMLAEKLNETHKSARDSGQAITLAGRRFSHQSKDRMNATRFKIHLAKRRIGLGNNGHEAGTKTTTKKSVPRKTTGGGVELGNAG